MQYVVVYSVHDVWSCNVRQSVSMIVVVVCKKWALQVFLAWPCYSCTV